MRIINAGFELMDELDAPSIYTKLERCGRTCYQSQDVIDCVEDIHTFEEFYAWLMKGGGSNEKESQPDGGM